MVKGFKSVSLGVLFLLFFCYLIFSGCASENVGLPTDGELTPTPTVPVAGPPEPQPSPTPDIVVIQLPGQTPIPTATQTPQPLPTPTSELTPILTPTPTPESTPTINGVIGITRDQGIAPLAILVDGMSSSGLIDNDYVSAGFNWSFGDPNSGSWSTTGQSKDQAAGFLSAHVYEQPGTYQVSVQVQDAAGHQGSASRTIQVQPFSGTTYYVSSVSGDDANDGLAPEPQGSGHGPWKTLAKVHQSAGGDANPTAIMGGNLQVLFKRGETFIGSGLSLSQVNPTGQAYLGPIIIGAYGSGDRPVIQVSDPNSLGVDLEENCHDVVLMDLSLVGTYTWAGAEPSTEHIGIRSGADVSRVLVLRTEVRNFEYGVLWDNLPASEMFIVDSQIHHNYRVQVGSNNGNKLVLLGSQVEDSYLSHNLYAYFQDSYYLAHNHFARPGWNERGETIQKEEGYFYSNRCNLRLAIDTENVKNVVVANNICADGCSKIQIGLMDSSSVGVHYENVLIEKNRTENSKNAFWMTNGIFLDSVQNAVIRNNVMIHGPLGSNDVAINVDYSAYGDSKCVSSSNLKIYNNSYKSQYEKTTENSARFMILRRADSSNILVKNNIAVLSSTADSKFDNLIFELPDKYAMTNIISDYNVFQVVGNTTFALLGTQPYSFTDWKALLGQDANSKQEDPLYSDSETDKNLLKVQSVAKGYLKNSPAIDTGVSVPVFEDYNGIKRPQGSAWDIGANESSQ